MSKITKRGRSLRCPKLQRKGDDKWCLINHIEKETVDGVL